MADKFLKIVSAIPRAVDNIHDAEYLKGVAVDDGGIADGKFLRYSSTGPAIVYDDMPVDSNTMARDGARPPTANHSWNNFDLTNVKNLQINNVATINEIAATGAIDMSVDGNNILSLESSQALFSGNLKFATDGQYAIGGDLATVGGPNRPSAVTVGGIELVPGNPGGAYFAGYKAGEKGQVYLGPPGVGLVITCDKFGETWIQSTNSPPVPIRMTALMGFGQENLYLHSNKNLNGQIGLGDGCHVEDATGAMHVGALRSRAGDINPIYYGPYGSGDPLIDYQPADPSAMLEVSATDRGFLPPRLTTAQRDAIASPAVGLVIFNTTTNKHEGYNGTWNAMY